MPDKLTRDGLNKHLFGAADILRKRLDPPEYRPLIMTLLYIKRLSDTFEEKIDHLIKVEKRSEKEAYQKFRHTGSFVPEAARWKEVRKIQPGMGSKINKVCRAIEEENSPKLDDVLTNTKFDNRQKFPDDTLELVVSHFDSKNLGNNNLESPDIFGDAYEYLLAEFAGEIKTKGGQFFTPREIVGLLVKITNPQENMRICDPTCGSGGMLISSYNHVKNSGGDPDNLTLHGQDSNYTTVGMCKMNMVLHNVADFDIRHEDVLKTPLFVEGGNLMKYDKVLANFPFSENWQNASADSDRYHRFAYGIPPAKDKADFAFIQHMLTSLNDTGQATIISSQGVLFRGGEEEKIRKNMILGTEDLQGDVIEGIIALPSKVFHGTSIPACVVILNKAKPKERKNKIIFIYAAKDYKPDPKRNSLRDEDVKKIHDAFTKFKDIDKYCHVADLEEIEENEFNLNVPRYVDISEPEEKIDIQKEIDAIKEAREDSAEGSEKVDADLAELKFKV